MKRALVISGAALAVLGGAALAGLHVATRALKDQVQQALGPDSEVAEITVGWSAIEARGVRIRAPKGWPAQDALRAERVVVTPDLAGLFSAKVQVSKIAVDNAYLSVWRTREGKVRLLPSLLEKPKAGGVQPAAGQPDAPQVSIGSIELRGGVLDFFDSSVRQPAHKTRLEQLHVQVDDLRVPGLAGRTGLALDGVVKGVQRDGRVTIGGWAELADRNSEITTKLAGVDLVALQPYLIKASETGVRHGTLDLALKSTVRNNRLHAPGTVTLSGLELAPGSGAFGTFMGVPRQAVIAALKNRNGQIAIQFTLEGNLNDPQFSLNDSFAKRIGASVAETLGISIEGLTRGVGNAAQGLGGMVKKLFGK
ncbi:MAG TPA: DUF748 domain-containing protein [Noviherbaspirillum sp.]|nr:DUF748 domain-containing protein [Noviherbaspirillum sp.]